MSLEQAINDHAAAIRELAAAITGAATANIITKGPATTKTEVKIDAEKPSTAKAAVEQALAKAEEAAAAKKEQAKEQAKEPAKQETAGGAELDFDKDVAPHFQSFLKAKGRDAGLALLKEYGARVAAGVPKERMAEFVADIKAALEA